MRWLIGPLVVSLVALGACVGDPVNGSQGNQDGPCFANQTCNAGLQCVSGTCRALSADGGPCIVGKSTLGNCTLTK